MSVSDASVAPLSPMAKATRVVTEPVVDGWKRWRDFWFTPEDAITLGIIRVLTGWMLTYSLIVWGLDFEAFFGHNGLQPIDAIRDFHKESYAFSFWMHVPESLLFPVHCCCVLIAVMFCLGLGTRATSIAAYVITISYSQRVPVANFGLDQILGFLCMYLAIGPSGRCLSLDAVIRRWWRRRVGEGESEQVEKFASARVALRLIQLHMCVIYFWAGFAKLKGDSWWTGEALWQVLANQEYQTMDLTWMAWIPWLPYLLAHITVAWEVFFCVLIWNRKLRPIMLLIGTGMHFGIGAFLGMWTFGLIMTYAYFAFSDAEKWRNRLEWIFHTSGSSRDEDPINTDRVISDVLAELSPRPAPVLSTKPSVPQPVVSSKPGRTTKFIRPRKTAPATIEENAEEMTPSALAMQHNKPVKQQQSAEPDDATLSLAELDEPKPTIAELHDDHPAADQRLLSDDATLLLMSRRAEERTILRRYFRSKDIPFRAVTTPESAISAVDLATPAAIVISGANLSPQEIQVLAEDLRDISEVPMLLLLTSNQYESLRNSSVPGRILRYPASPRKIREALSKMMFSAEEADSDLQRQRGQQRFSRS